jgi:hypothetical protein
MTKLVKITLASTADDPSDLTLYYYILDNPLAELWVERMANRMDYTIDHPSRFYGFNDQSVDQQRAKKWLMSNINVVNSYQKIIDDINLDDQNSLNHLHSVFEIYHGPLNEQTGEFWKTAPIDVRKALAEINVAIHALEAANSYSRNPRFVCTWWGMPKTHRLDDDIMGRYGNLRPDFGTLLLGYAEIGKTLEDLTNDDEEISELGFKPFDHYSADFSAVFFQESPEEINHKLRLMKTYYFRHKDFLLSKGYNDFNHPRLLPYRFPVAQLIENAPRKQIVEQIAKHQYVKMVKVE